MTIEEARRWFANEIRAVGQLTSDALVEGFARVPREAFLGDGPWHVLRPSDPTAPYQMTPDADPRHLYHDVLVAIDPERRLNNGHPSSLALWIQAADIRPGDRVLHIGSGVGYYTAILAEVTGPRGSVVAYEVDERLAARAAAALRSWSTVQVVAGDASAPVGPFDAIFVNAGCTHARPEWLAAVAPGGRMVIPLTIHLPGMPVGVGVMLRLERGEARWPARIVSPVGIFDCVNARDAENEAELRKLAGLGAPVTIGAVAVEPHERGDACIAHLPGFCVQK